MSACCALSHPAAGPEHTHTHSTAYTARFLMILIIFKMKAFCAIRKTNGEKQQQTNTAHTVRNVRKTDLRCVCVCVCFFRPACARTPFRNYDGAINTCSAASRAALTRANRFILQCRRRRRRQLARSRDSRSENFPSRVAAAWCSPLIALLFVFN